MRVLLFALAIATLSPILAFAQARRSSIVLNGTFSSAIVNGILIPDRYKLPGDGADDARSIQRAIDALCIKGGGELNMLARHYALYSAITQTCAIKVMGQGWQEAPVTIATAAGTWLDVDQTAKPAWTLTTIAAKGSEFHAIAVDEPGQTAPVTSGSWAPVVYPYVFAVNNIGGKVDFDDVFLDGVYNGIYAFNTGRLEINELLGQWFNVGIYLDQNEDVDHITNVHDWTYYSVDLPVIAYQQAHTIGIQLDRVDTPFLDQLFFFGVQYGIQLNTKASGVATKLHIGSIACDATQVCDDIEAPNTSQFISQIDTSGESGVGSGVPLSGASVLHFGTRGQGFVDVGSIEATMLDSAVITNINTLACSNMYAEQVAVDFSHSTETVVSLYSAPALCGNGTNAFNLPTAPTAILNVGISQTFTNTFGPGVTLFSALQVGPIRTFASSPPVCTRSTAGELATITNSSTATPGATVTTGGTNTVLEWCNGAHYIVLR